jgi:hypothetical protein
VCFGASSTPSSGGSSMRAPAWSGRVGFLHAWHSSRAITRPNGSVPGRCMLLVAVTRSAPSKQQGTGLPAMHQLSDQERRYGVGARSRSCSSSLAVRESPARPHCQRP